MKPIVTCVPVSDGSCNWADWCQSSASLSIPKVIGCRLKNGRVIFALAEHRITGVAEQAPNLPGQMIVVNAKVGDALAPRDDGFGLTADFAKAATGFKHPFISSQAQPVLPSQEGPPPLPLPLEGALMITNTRIMARLAESISSRATVARAMYAELTQGFGLVAEGAAAKADGLIVPKGALFGRIAISHGSLLFTQEGLW
jgi:hypothetical protein